ncbi:hypothetical protein Sgly_1978 [Syntrophobotulus glycolicus DSM 8271]|uniref:Uncharacterized protein n=1 Tax=Syntrophobotulus glycolicus (strain DSM 8271 / FlGlyR) TaxID=645991 RepID=F0T1D2_SYNGF|nr:hypothetical protein [Syntrophobotulus glycolicus]ADY56273.1 hypothetical protein Sgly_1978 [Syntrophobotulus glycolicus DSM 8271]
MKNKFKKVISCVLLMMTILVTGGVIPANATVIEQPSASIIKAQVSDVKAMNDKITQCLIITDSQIIFDVDKASKVGLSNDQINNLKNTYTEMNKMVQNKSLSIVETKNGTYDIQSNKNTEAYTTNVAKNYSGTSGQISPNLVTPRWYGWDFWWSASECSDIAAILAGGSISAATLAGILGLTGVGMPVAVASTIAMGVMGLGSAYFWYASNHGGVSGSFIPVAMASPITRGYTLKFHVNN